MSDKQPKPLNCPDFKLPPELNSGLLSRVPILGNRIINKRIQREIAPLKKEINRQLAERNRFPEELWSNNPEKIDFVKSIGAIIKHQLDWANNHFIPEDSVNLVFWVSDPTDLLMIIEKIDKLLQIKTTDRPNWTDSLKGTLGNFIDFFYEIYQQEKKDPTKVISWPTEAEIIEDEKISWVQLIWGSFVLSIFATGTTLIFVVGIAGLIKTFYQFNLFLMLIFLMQIAAGFILGFVSYLGLWISFKEAVKKLKPSSPKDFDSKTAGNDEWGYKNID